MFYQLIARDYHGNTVERVSYGEIKPAILHARSLFRQYDEYNVVEVDAVKYDKSYEYGFRYAIVYFACNTTDEEEFHNPVF